jgi:hypothetical protein
MASRAGSRQGARRRSESPQHPQSTSETPFSRRTVRLRCPPLILVATHRIRGGDVLLGRGLEPPVGHNRPAVDATAIENELPEACVVAQGGLQATAGQFVMRAGRSPRPPIAPCRTAPRSSPTGIQLAPVS